jgi:hypothetical protein
MLCLGSVTVCNSDNGICRQLPPEPAGRSHAEHPRRSTEMIALSNG